MEGREGKRKKEGRGGVEGKLVAMWNGLITRYKEWTGPSIYPKDG